MHSGPEQQQVQIKTGKKAPEGFLLEDKIDKKKINEIDKILQCTQRKFTQSEVL